MKKTICIFCAMLVTGMMTSVPCLALENNVFDSSLVSQSVPYNLIIWGTKANSYRNGSELCSSVIASYESIYSAKMSVIVQRSTDEINWSKAGSLGTVSGYNGKLSLDGDYPAVSGYSYRLEATVTVYDGGSVVETLTFHSNIV